MVHLRIIGVFASFRPLRCEIRTQYGAWRCCRGTRRLSVSRYKFQQQNTRLAHKQNYQTSTARGAASLNNPQRKNKRLNALARKIAPRVKIALGFQYHLFQTQAAVSDHATIPSFTMAYSQNRFSNSLNSLGVISLLLFPLTSHSTPWRA